jgi:AcrR family transcriptional regulator
MAVNIRTYSENPELVASRRQHIARCAACVFVKNGYERANVHEIAAACSMSVGTLYHYIGSKTDILHLVIEQALARKLEAIETISANSTAVSPTQALKQAFELICRRIDENQDITVFIYQETKNLEASARQGCLDMEMRCVAAVETLLTRGCATGDFSIRDIRAMAHNIMVTAEMWAFRRWSLRKSYTLEEYISEQTELILRAIGADKDAAS